VRPLLPALTTYLHQKGRRDRRWCRRPRSVQTNLQSGVATPLGGSFHPWVEVRALTLACAALPLGLCSCCLRVEEGSV
jgi:hypothetical protein